MIRKTRVVTSLLCNKCHECGGSERVERDVVKRGKMRDVTVSAIGFCLWQQTESASLTMCCQRGLPAKGVMLTRMSEFCFDQLDVNHHYPPNDLTTLPRRRAPALVLRPAAGWW